MGFFDAPLTGALYLPRKRALAVQEASWKESQQRENAQTQGQWGAGIVNRQQQHSQGGKKGLEERSRSGRCYPEQTKSPKREEGAKKGED